jgi:hypothetical protein
VRESKFGRRALATHEQEKQLRAEACFNTEENLYTETGAAKSKTSDRTKTATEEKRQQLKSRD